MDLYVDAFLARCTAARPGEVARAPGPELHGLLPADGDPRVRLLVTDDAAHDALAALLPGAAGGMITVLAAAARSRRLVRADPAWTGSDVTAMVCRDLGAVTGIPLPGDLALRPVARGDGDDHSGAVALEDAAAFAVRAAPAGGEPAAVRAAYLRSLPPGTRLLAAVDGDGTVRATAGAAVAGAYSSVFFVNTDPECRRRGIGRAMTAAALHVARAAGATRACLDASDAGRRIYAGLGFEAVGGATQFFRAG